MATEAQLTRRTERIKTQLATLGDLRPGTLTEQYNTCRTPGCRCKADPPQRHGAPTTNSATAVTAAATPRTCAPKTSPPCAPNYATITRCANSSTGGSMPPSS